MPDPTPLPIPQDTPANPQLQQHLAAVTRLRQSGYSWEDIGAYYGQQTQRLRTAGYNEGEIRSYYGGTDPAPVASAIDQRVQQNVATGQHKSVVDAFVDGLTDSSTAALLGVTPHPDQPGEGHAAALTHAISEAGADLAVAIPSAFVGGRAVTAAVARIPGLSEFAVPAGGLAGAFSANATPTLIKDERDAWIKAGHSGWNAGDFLAQHGASAAAAVDTAQQGAVGVATMAVGGAVGGRLAKAGLSGTGRTVAKLGAEAATYTGAEAALKRQMPTMQEFVDGAILLGAFHVGGKASEGAYANYRARLEQHYVETGQMPAAAAAEARNDPVFRRQLMGEARPTPRVGSSRTPITGDGVQRTTPAGARDLTAPPQDSYVVPRVAGHFDDALQFTLQHEGSTFVEHDSNGANVKYGINAADNPGVDIKHLSAGEAGEIYKTKYWDAVGADTLPPQMRLAAFDTAVVEGVGRAKQWLAESGGDVKAFLNKRAAFEANLARTNPAKYGKYVQSWANRIRDLGGQGGHQIALAGIVARNPDDPLTDQEVALLKNEGQTPPDEPPKPPPPSPFGDPGSDDGQHWDRVMDRVATAPGGDGWWGKTTTVAQGVYRDLFNRGHPIDRLMAAVQQGHQIDDAANPQFLMRLAENSDDLSKYAIERNMIGLDGRITGKSLKAVVEGVGDAKEQDRFTRGYAMARWALMMAEQGKDTGVDLDDARKVVEESEAGGVMPMPTDVSTRARLNGIPISFSPIDAFDRQRIGPHYNVTTKTVHMPELSDEEYRARYHGAGREEVLAHEVGHALAYHFGMKIGNGDWSHLSPTDLERLNDDLQIASRRFRPEFWAKGSGQESYVRTGPELMADSIATWMTDPVARTRMPDFERILTDAMNADRDAKKAAAMGTAAADPDRPGTMAEFEAGLERRLGPRFDIGLELGEKPEKWGTPMQQALDEITNWRNESLRWLRDGGIINSEQYRAWVATHEVSIPGYRDMGNGKWAPGAPGRNVWNPVREALGSTKKVQPILHSLMQDAFLRHALATQNLGNVALVDAAKSVDLVSEKRAVDVNVVSTLEKLRDEGIDESVISDLKRSTSHLVPKDQVPIFRNGKLWAAKFDPSVQDVVPVLRGYDQGPRNMVMKVAGAIAAIPRKMQTVANPLFPLKMLGYDLPWQFITNPDARGPVSNFYAGLRGTFKEPELYDQWLRSGGAERAFATMSHDAYLKSVFEGEQSEGLGAGAMNLVKSGWHGMQAWSNMVSAPMRFGRYARGLERGESEQRAAVASTEAAFHRPGYGGVFGRSWNTLVPYLTAHLNGLEKTVRAQLGIGHTITGAQYDWKSTTLKAAAVLTVPALAQWWAFKDQEWYKAAPDWKKDNGFFIPMPGGGHMFIAAPPLVSALYIGLPRRLASMFLEDNPHAFDNFSEGLGASLMPPGGLSAASFMQPFVEHIANFSFLRDQPLVNPDTLRGTGAAEQYNHYSTGAARAIARFASDIPLLSNMHLSPPVVDNYIRFWAGAPGLMALHTVDAALGAGSPNQPPATPFGDWPGVSSWTTRYPSASAQPTEDFYRRSDQMNQVHGSLVQAMRDGDIGRFRELAARDPSAAAYHMMRFKDEPSSVDTGPYVAALAQASSQADWQDISLVRQSERAMTQAGAYARKVWESPQLSGQDKRQILDQTYATMQTMAERSSEAMDRAHIGGARASSHAPRAPASITFVPPDARVH